MTYTISPEMRTRLENDFVYHAPFGDQSRRYEFVRWRGGNFAEQLCYTCPPSRELSLALTKIDEAVFFANAAIARNETAPDTYVAEG